jgi:hypothetical protein
MANGLARVSSEELKRLLIAIHRRTLSFPVSRANLIACAFGNIEQHLELILGLDAIAAQRLIVAVLHERQAHAKSRASGAK